MKKILAILVILMLAFTLSACSLLSASYEDDLEFGSEKPDDSYTYSALNINVLALVTQDEQGSSDIMYEIELVFEDNFVSKSEAEIIMNGISSNLYIDTNYLTSYELAYNGFTSYDCFCFAVTGSSGGIEHKESNYGFFYINHDYALTAPSWLNSLREVAYYSAKDYLYFTSKRIVPDAVRLRYYLVADAPLVSDGAAEIYKNVYDGEMLEYYQALKWIAAEDYDFLSISVSQRSMASGWYVIAIALGVATVVIILLVAKNKKPQVSNYGGVKVEVSNSPFEESNEKEDSQHNQNISVENQISIEDFMGRTVNGSEEGDGR